MAKVKGTDPYSTLEAEALKDQQSRLERIKQEQERTARWDRLDLAFLNIDVNMPGQWSEIGIDYRRWAENIAAFCEAVKREGFEGRLKAEGCTHQPTLNALSLIHAGLEGGETAIGVRMLELRKEEREGWMRVFNRYDLAEFLGAIRTPPVDPKPTKEVDAAAQEVEPSRQRELRPAYHRDHTWLRWHESENLGPADIRDRWNAMSHSDRMEICPEWATTIESGHKGREVVKSALKLAKAERGR